MHYKNSVFPFLMGDSTGLHKVFPKKLRVWCLQPGSAVPARGKSKMTSWMVRLEMPKKGRRLCQSSGFCLWMKWEGVTYWSPVSFQSFVLP